MAAFAQVTQAEVDATLELELSFGVNHIDVAASYGEAENSMMEKHERHASEVEKKVDTYKKPPAGKMTFYECINYG